MANDTGNGQEHSGVDEEEDEGGDERPSFGAVKFFEWLNGEKGHEVTKLAIAAWQASKTTDATGRNVALRSDGELRKQQLIQRGEVLKRTLYVQAICLGVVVVSVVALSWVGKLETPACAFLGTVAGYLFGRRADT